MLEGFDRINPVEAKDLNVLGTGNAKRFNETETP